MVTYRLRWLTLLGVLGILGWILKQPLFYALFGFAAFVPLFWYDERTESIFRRAAATAFVVGVVAFAAVSAYLGMLLGPRSQRIEGWDVVGAVFRAFLSLELAHVVLLLTFAASYIYLYRKGT